MRRGINGTSSQRWTGCNHAHSYETLALNTPIAYLAPYSSREGDHFDYWWHLIQYAFDLPDPSAFPELSISAEDLPLVKRYCSAADDLAGSQFLAHPTQLSELSDLWPLAFLFAGLPA